MSRPPCSSRASTGILAERFAGRVETAALYGAFALIAAIVFGTMSVHPF